MKKQRTKPQWLKLARRKKQRKDFELKRNVNSNRRSETYEVKKDILGPARGEKGETLTDEKDKDIIVKVGTLTFLKKRKVARNGLPMPYPKSRKFTMAKKECVTA